MRCDHSFSQKTNILEVIDRNPWKIDNPSTDSDSRILVNNCYTVHSAMETVVWKKSAESFVNSGLFYPLRYILYSWFWKFLIWGIKGYGNRNFSLNYVKKYSENVEEKETTITKEENEVKVGFNY